MFQCVDLDGGLISACYISPGSPQFQKGISEKKTISVIDYLLLLELIPVSHFFWPIFQRLPLKQTRQTSSKSPIHKMKSSTSSIAALALAVGALVLSVPATPLHARQVSYVSPNIPIHQQQTIPVSHDLRPKAELELPRQPRLRPEHTRSRSFEPSGMVLDPRRQPRLHRPGEIGPGILIRLA